MRSSRSGNQLLCNPLARSKAPRSLKNEGFRKLKRTCPLFYSVKWFPVVFYVSTYHPFYADNSFVSNLFYGLHCLLPYQCRYMLPAGWRACCCKMDSQDRRRCCQATDYMRHSTMNHICKYGKSFSARTGSIRSRNATLLISI